MTTDPWKALGALAEDGAEACNYTHDEHLQGNEALKCLRAPGHKGARIAVDMHLASVDGEPVFFGEPLALDPEVPQ